MLVDEFVFDLHSNGRGFFPALVSRNDGVVLLFLLHCFDALEYLCTVLMSFLCSGLSRVIMSRDMYHLLSVYHVCILVRIKSLISECLLPFKTL